MQILLEVIVAAAVLFAVGAFIAGRLDGAVKWPPDARPFPLPDGRLGPDDVDKARFSIAFRGYRMADVDAAMERLAGELATRDTELDRLREGSDREADGEVRAEGEPVAGSAAGIAAEELGSGTGGEPATAAPATGAPAAPASVAADAPTGSVRARHPAMPVPDAARPEPADDA